MVAHALNPRTQEAEAGGSLRVPGQSGYIGRPCLKNKIKTVSEHKRREQDHMCPAAQLTRLSVHSDANVVLPLSTHFPSREVARWSPQCNGPQ